MRSRRLAALVSLAAMLAGACRPSSPTAVSDPYAGVWSGSIIDLASGEGALQFVLTAQPAGGLLGSWTATFSNAAANNGGTLSAIVPIGPPLVFGAGCRNMGSAIFTMTVDGNRMRGTYESIFCEGLDRGTAELIKQ